MTLAKIKVNTYQGSEEVMEQFNPQDTSEYKHTKQMKENLERYLDKAVLELVSFGSILQAANLHGIGLSSELKNSGIPPYDAYSYLRSNEWREEVADLVLLQSIPIVEEGLHSKEIVSVVNSAKKRTSAHDLRLFVLAKYTSSEDGKPVTLNDKVKEITDKYGRQTKNVLHAKYIVGILHSSYETARLIKKFDLA